MKYRHFFFAAVCLATLAILVFRPAKNENQTIESMFAMDDELHDSYLALKRIFGGNEIILIVYQDDQLMNQTGFDRQHALCERLHNVEGISGEPIGIESMVSMIRAINLERLQPILKFSGFDLNTQLLIDRAKELFSGFTHSVDQNTAAVIVTS